MTVGAVVAQLRLDMTNFREGMAKANSLMEQYTEHGMKAASMLGGFAAAAAGGLGVAVKWSAEFEQQMRNVNSILHETEPNIKAIGDAVLNLAGKTGQAPAVLARGLYDIASSGFSGADGLKVLEAAARAATAGLSDTATASRAITAVLNAYGMSASEAGHVSDVMFKTVERGVLTFGDLAQNMGDVVAMAATAKVPIKEVGAAIAAMTKAGIQPAEAFTSLNMVLRSLINPTEEAKAAAEDMGLAWNATALATNGLEGTFKNLGAVLKTSVKDVDALTKAGASESEIMAVVAQNAGMTTEKLTALFPEVRALRGALVLASQGGQVFSQELQFMAEATGSTARAFAEQSKAVALQWQKTWATIQAFGIEAGAILLPALKAMTSALRTVVEMLRTMGEAAPILRSLLVAAIGLTAAFAALTAAVILYNTQIKSSIPLMLGLLGAMKQMIVGMATTKVTLAGVAGGFGLLKTAATGALAAIKGLTLASVASVGALGGIALAGYTVSAGLLRAAEAMSTTQKELDELVDKASKAGMVLPVGLYEDLQPPPMVQWVSQMREALGLAPLKEIEQARKQQEMLKHLVELNAEYAASKVEAEANAQSKLKELRQTELQNELDRIEQERTANIKAGVDERLASEVAETQRMAARQHANAAMMKLEAELLEAEGKTHQARIQAIAAEVAEWKEQNAKRFSDSRELEARADRLRRAKTLAMDREEAQERAKAFEEAAGRIVSDWTGAVETMRQADQLSTSEYLDQLSKVLDLIRQINAARAAAGQHRLFQQDELRIAQTIFSERKRMQQELTAGEKKLADARKQWAQEELTERKRLNDYELSLFDLTFQHRRDLLKITGQEDEQTLAQIAQEELATLQQRRDTEQLSAEARLDSLERERQLILEIAQAGTAPQGDMMKALSGVFEAMKSAREEFANQEKTAFEERRKQHEEMLKQVESEQKTIRTQLSATAGRITETAQSVFDVIERRIKALGTIKLEPAYAGAGGGRVYNINVDSQAVAASPAARKAIEDLIRAIAPQAVADDLEGAVRFPRS